MGPLKTKIMGKISKDPFTGGSDSETEEIQTENEYAKNYNVWRKKEELNKLKTKYGENALETIESSSSSSDDDEDAAELTEEVEKDFFKTLSYLKQKDPKIYDNNVSFFKPISSVKVKKVKEDVMFLKDYERKLLLEKGGVLSDEDETNDDQKPLLYAKEQQQIREDLVKLGATIEEGEKEDKFGGIFEVRNKIKEHQKNDERNADYLQWLTGQMEEIQDDEIKSQLKPLKDFWDNPNLDSGEKFLRDYVLKKRYLEKADDNYLPTYEEIVHDSDESLSGDENEIEKQEEFEHKYNFRFEEPDQEFIKRYPRTIEQSVRKTDDKRKVKRAETKERKRKEKEEKKAEIKQLQSLKRQEIEEKIEKLKEVTGTTDIAFQDDDLEGDFDPEAHDKRMQALFSDEFYQGQETDQKPEFPDIDQELEIENWDHWEQEQDYNQPHCEDDDFNMDADFHLTENTASSSKDKKKRRKKSKVAEALSRHKPKFDPNDKNYEKYFDEYYKLECEDVIGDIPCRFKYRQVVPNNFGLSTEEILLAKDKELNRWCSLKKMVQRRPDNVEKYEQIAYAKKSSNVTLKQRLLPSLFSSQSDEGQEVQTPSTSNDPVVELTTIIKDGEQEVKNEEPESKKRKKKKKKNNTKAQKTEPEQQKAIIVNSEKKRRKRPSANNTDKIGGKKMKKDVVNIGISDARLSAFGINPKRFKNKLKYGHKNTS